MVKIIELYQRSYYCQFVTKSKLIIVPSNLIIVLRLHAFDLRILRNATFLDTLFSRVTGAPIRLLVVGQGMLPERSVGLTQGSLQAQG
jgi:hypothetical protein